MSVNRYVSVEDFDASNSIQYNLAIRFKPNGFSFVITDAENRLLVLSDQQFSTSEESYWEKLFGQLMADPALAHVADFKTVSVITGEPCALIPDVLFQSDDLEVYASMTGIDVQENRLSSSHLIKDEMHLVSGLPIGLSQQVSEHLPKAKIHFVEEVLFAGMRKSGAINKDSEVVLIHFSTDRYHIVAVKEDKVLLSNMYELQSTEDFIYQVLFTYNTLGLSQEFTPLHVTGELEKRSALYDLMYKYIRHVNFLSPDKLITFSKEFDELPLHFYFCELSQMACV